MPAERTGPALTVVASCQGCAHLITDARDPRLGRAPHAACVHPTRANGGRIFARARGPYPTPADCPELDPARLALGRALVGDALPAKKDDRWFGGLIAALATIARYPAGMTAKGVMKEHGVTIADLRDSEQGVPQEIDDIEASR